MTDRSDRLIRIYKENKVYFLNQMECSETEEHYEIAKGLFETTCNDLKILEKPIEN